MELELEKQQLQKELRIGMRLMRFASWDGAVSDVIKEDFNNEWFILDVLADKLKQAGPARYLCAVEAKVCGSWS